MQTACAVVSGEVLRVLEVLLEEGGLESDLERHRRNRKLERILTDLDYKDALGENHTVRGQLDDSKV